MHKDAWFLSLAHAPSDPTGNFKANLDIQDRQKDCINVVGEGRYRPVLDQISKKRHFKFLVGSKFCF
jgi:hypothetical protein